MVGMLFLSRCHWQSNVCITQQRPKQKLPQKGFNINIFTRNEPKIKREEKIALMASTHTQKAKREKVSASLRAELTIQFKRAGGKPLDIYFPAWKWRRQVGVL